MEKMDHNSETAARDVKTASDNVRMSRRRLLKAGAAAAPVVITLQSGTAWAASMSCAERVVFPVLTHENQKELEKLLQSVGESKSLVTQFGSFTFQQGNPAHMAYLQAEVASCWSSFV